MLRDVERGKLNCNEGMAPKQGLLEQDMYYQGTAKLSAAVYANV
jgi:hypothetical protein